MGFTDHDENIGEKVHDVNLFAKSFFVGRQLLFSPH